EFHEQFLPDAPVRVDMVTKPAIDMTGPGEVGTFIGGAVERFEFFEFVILNSHIVLRAGGDPDVAHARLYMAELRQDASNGLWSQAFGLYRDEYRRVDGRWWFGQRSYQSLARTGRGEVLPFPHHFDVG